MAVDQHRDEMVERLRGMMAGSRDDVRAHSTVLWAADEIERLRAALDQASALCSRAGGCVPAHLHRHDHNPHRHDHNPLNADLTGGICPACEWEANGAGA